MAKKAINITMPRNVIHATDKYAKINHLNQS